MCGFPFFPPFCIVPQSFFVPFVASLRRSPSSNSLPFEYASSSKTALLQLTNARTCIAWEGVRWLSDRERDEIDFAVKVALRKSVDRVRELEALEKARIANESRQNPNTGLSRLLGLPVPSPHSTSSEALASHRAFTTLYLNTLLADVSRRQRDQQEARVQRQLDKNASLGGMGGGGALGMDVLGRQMADTARSEYAATKGKSKERDPLSPEVGQVPSIYRPAPIVDPLEGDEDDYDVDALGPLGGALTAEQIQQFEAEESELLKATQSDLEALKTAESSLLEIAALQSQLAVHLGQQAELTDKLWEDAVVVTGKVDEGNQQLKKAKERGRESRVWLLIFLFGSSFTLLFLDYYSS